MSGPSRALTSTTEYFRLNCNPGFPLPTSEPKAYPGIRTDTQIGDPLWQELHTKKDGTPWFEIVC